MALLLSMNIIEGKWTWDDVGSLWKEETAELLKEQGYEDLIGEDEYK